MLNVPSPTLTIWAPEPSGVFHMELPEKGCCHGMRHAVLLSMVPAASVCACTCVCACAWAAVLAERGGEPDTAPTTIFPPTDAALNNVHVCFRLFSAGRCTNNAQLGAFSHAAQQPLIETPASCRGPTPLAAKSCCVAHVPVVLAREHTWAESVRSLGGAAEAVTTARTATTERLKGKIHHQEAVVADGAVVDILELSE